MAHSDPYDFITVIKKALASCDLFSELTPDEMNLVSGLMRERTVRAGRYIVHEGEEAFSVFAVEHGSVDVVKETDEGSNPKITELSDGSIFGEVAFFDHPARSAGVIAHDDVQIFELKYKDLEEIAKTNPTLGLKLYRSMAHSLSRKVRKTTDDLAVMVGASRLAALGEMTTAISHEINNPLTSIMLNADLIARLISETPNNAAVIAERSNKIRETVQIVVRIVDGLKSLARNAASDPFVETTLASVVSSTLETCQERFKSTGTTIRAGNLDPEISALCRPVQVAQVLLNLFNNALDAVENQKEKWILVEVEGDAKYVHIYVSDSGSGIDPKIRERIFQPFFTTKSRGRGTGLGLSISRSLIEAHGGILRLDPASKHTRFVVSLPKQPSGE